MMKMRVNLIEYDKYTELRKAGKSIRGHGKRMTAKVSDDEYRNRQITIAGIRYYIYDAWQAATSQKKRVSKCR